MPSLIANSGIQFIEIKIDLSDNAPAMTKVKGEFAEIRDDEQVSFLFPYYHAGRGQYIEKESINPDAIAPDGAVNEEIIKEHLIFPIPEHQIFTISARQAIECFEEIWLPVPYLRKRNDPNNPFQTGPLAWARMWFSRIPATERGKDPYTHSVVLTFDTQTSSAKLDAYHMPTDEDAQANATIYNTFACAVDERFNLEFYTQEWVQNWLKIEYDQYTKQNNIREEFEFRHVGFYLTLLKVLDTAEAFPEVVLYASESTSEVALVLDIGNSRTCGLLIETEPPDKKTFDFTQARRLAIRNLSKPSRVYKNPFEMQIAFVDESFGIKESTQLTGLENYFSWPSLVRVGPEASRLAVINDKADGLSTMSSPKRYLWDKKLSQFPWRFVNSEAIVSNEGIGLQFTDEGLLKVYVDKQLDRGKIINGKIPINYNKIGKEVVKEYIRTGKYFDSNGFPLNPVNNPNYSRGSLMTFALAEIFMHAITYVNSYEFRLRQGHPAIARKLKTIVVTCPTAMSKTEQIRLREHAEDAIDALKTHFGDSFIDIDLQIMPSPFEIGKPIEKRKTWAFDEATCSQLSYLYGEIIYRFRGNSKLYFQLLGKKREDTRFPDQPSVTIASVDIGGGTTDLMICSYQNSPDSNITSLIPQPHFWEGFNLAGDNILKKIIERIILNEVKEAAENSNIKDPAEVMNYLFGENFGGQDAQDRIMRKQFASQIAIPIAHGILQHAIQGNNVVENRTFESFFLDHPMPNAKLIHHINTEFQKRGAEGFNLRNIVWRLNSKETNKVVSDVLDRMIKDLCGIIAQYHCDYVLLAGRPTMLPIIRLLFLNYLPVSPDCIIPMNNYRIGKWYPFTDSKGVITDPKTCVVVGASIALMSEYGLADFVLDTKWLKQVDSTADYFGRYNKNKANIPKDMELFTPTENNKTIQYDGELVLGMRQMPSEKWLAAPMYVLRYKTPKAAREMRGKYAFPLSIELERNNRDKEAIRIVGIVDRNGNKVNHSAYLELDLRTIIDEYGYWMDTGSFSLNIFNKNIDGKID